VLRRRELNRMPDFCSGALLPRIRQRTLQKEAVVERNPYLTEREQREMAEIERLLVAAERWSGGGRDRGGAAPVEREQR
jgi:hypothetical protein